MTKLKNQEFIVLFILFSISISTVGGGYYFIFGFDKFFEPSPVRIYLEKNKEISFEFIVKKRCVHELGVSFYSKLKDAEHIKKTFGQKISDLNLPVKIKIKIFNDAHEVIFERHDFGGKSVGFRYGPSPIKFIAGAASLDRGKYEVEIKVEETFNKISDFEVYFFATHVPKTNCG